MFVGDFYRDLKGEFHSTNRQTPKLLGPTYLGNISFRLIGFLYKKMGAKMDPPKDQPLCLAGL